MFNSHFFAAFSRTKEALLPDELQAGILEMTSVEGGRQLHSYNYQEGRFQLWSTHALSEDVRCAVFGNQDEGFVRFKSETDGVVVETDELGFGLFYYVEIPRALLICSEFEPLLPYILKEALNADSLYDFFIHGMTLQDQTLCRGLGMSPPGTRLSISNSGSFTWSSSPYEAKSKSPNLPELADQIYEIIKNKVRKLVLAEGFTTLALTGGADTRMMLSCLTRDERRNLRFWFDNKSIETSVKVANDWKVVKILEKEFCLNMAYGDCPLNETKSIRRSLKNELRTFERDFRTRILSGMFGGEILGGGVFEALGFKEAQENSLHAIRQLFRAFLGSTYGDRLWRHPHYFLYSRRTPFWTSELIKIMVSLPAQVYSEYRLYQLVYERHASDMLRIPFNSPIACWNSNFTRIPKQGIQFLKADHPVQMERQVHPLIENTLGPRTMDELKVHNKFTERAALVSGFIENSLGIPATF